MPTQESSREKKQIQALVSVHDRSQAEVRLNYNLLELEDLLKAPHTKLKVSKKYKASANVYFLFPNQWAVNDKTYPVGAFMTDLRQYIRFREPYINFSYVLKNENNPTNPYLDLIESLESLKERHTRKDINSAIQNIRSFGAGYIAHTSKKISKKLNRLEILSQREDELEQIKLEAKLNKCLESLDQTVRRSYMVIRNWRQMIIEIFEDDKQDYLREIVSEFRAVDEYCSSLFMDHIALIKSEIDSETNLNLAEVTPVLYKKLNWTLRSHIRLETYYNKKSDYTSVMTAHDLPSREYAVTRLQALKRRIWSSLFLSKYSKKKIYWSREFGFSMAAAIAQTWVFLSTILVLVYYPQLQVAGNKSWSAALLGANGLLAAGVFIAAYVVKDRIKETGRNLFRRKLEGEEMVLSDIKFTSPDNEEFDVANITETFRFSDVEKLPQVIQALFHKHAVDLKLRIGNESKILTVARDITIKPKKIARADTRSTAISEILRFNLERFQGIMGDPKKQGFAFDEEGEIKSLRVPKVYYLDAIVELIFERGNGLEPIRKYSYNRFVSNKKGLVRCDAMEI